MVHPPAASRHGKDTIPARPRRGESPPRGQCALTEKTCAERTRLHARDEFTFFPRGASCGVFFPFETGGVARKLIKSSMPAKEVLDTSHSFRLRCRQPRESMRRSNRRLP